MKELPKVFVSPIEKKIQNNKDLFYSKLLGDRKDTRDILKDIDNIFHSKNFVYNSLAAVNIEPATGSIASSWQGSIESLTDAIKLLDNIIRRLYL